MVTCPTCGAVNADEATTCATCGNSLSAAVSVDLDTGDALTRGAYLSQVLQTAAVAIVAISLLAVLFGLFRGIATDAPTQLNRFERVSVGIAEQTIPAYLLALILAIGLALLPWVINEGLPYKALAKAPIVLITSAVGAVIAAIAATVNVRANLIVQKPATWAFKWKLAAYLAQVLGLAVVIVILCAVGLGMTRPRASDYAEPILPDDAHGHEHDHLHDHGHTH